MGQTEGREGEDILLCGIQAPDSGSVLWDFGVILLHHTFTETHGEDHPQELNNCHSDTDSQNNSTVFKQPLLHTGYAARFIDGHLRGQGKTQPHLLDVCPGYRHISAGAGVHVLTAVLDPKVLRPVPWAGPSTALHRSLDVVPGVLCGPVLSSVVDDHAFDDVRHLIF